VKWNEENTLVTGEIEIVFYDSVEFENGDELIQVEVSENSPSYLIRRTNDGFVVLPHQAVMLKETNFHT
jgi:hypothetical protein